MSIAYMWFFYFSFTQFTNHLIGKVPLAYCSNPKNLGRDFVLGPLFFCSPFLAILRLTIFGTCDTSLERSSKVLSFAPRAVSHNYLLGSYEGLKFFRIHLIHSYIDSTLAHPTFTVRTFSRTS